MKKNSFLILTAAILFVFSFFFGVFNYSHASATYTLENPIEHDTFIELVDAVIGMIFMTAIAIVPVMIIVGGIYFLASGGDAAKTTTAKNIILYALIGFLIILSVRGLVALLKAILGG